MDSSPWSSFTYSTICWVWLSPDHSKDQKKKRRSLLNRNNIPWVWSRLRWIHIKLTYITMSNMKTYLPSVQELLGKVLNLFIMTIFYFIIYIYLLSTSIYLFLHFIIMMTDLCVVCKIPCLYICKFCKLPEVQKLTSVKLNYTGQKSFSSIFGQERSFFDSEQGIEAEPLVNPDKKCWGNDTYYCTMITVRGHNWQMIQDVTIWIVTLLYFMQTQWACHVSGTK